MKKRTHRLSRREREITDILHAEEKASIARIRECMESPPTANAVRALLQILEDKGEVKRTPGSGREFLFSPKESRKKAGGGALQHVLETFFEGSIEQALATHFAKNRSRLTVEDFAKLEKLIDQSKPNTDKTK